MNWEIILAAGLGAAAVVVALAYAIRRWDEGKSTLPRPRLPKFQATKAAPAIPPPTIFDDEDGWWHTVNRPGCDLCQRMHQKDYPNCEADWMHYHRAAT